MLHWLCISLVDPVFMLHWLRISLAEPAGFSVLLMVPESLFGHLSKLDFFRCSREYFYSATLVPTLIRRPRHCAPFVTPLVWHFTTKCVAVKFAEPWMPNHFSELRDHNLVRQCRPISSAMYPECSTKDWLGKSCWLNPWKNGSVVVQGLGGVIASPTTLFPGCRFGFFEVRLWKSGFF